MSPNGNLLDPGLVMKWLHLHDLRFGKRNPPTQTTLNGKPLTENQCRCIRRWRAGEAAWIPALDRLCIEVGLNLSEFYAWEEEREN